MPDKNSEASRFQQHFIRTQNAISRVMVGQERVIEESLIAFFSGGHILLEGLPGLGKTLLVQTLAQVLDLSYGRVQFTPDLMPADITGTNVLLEADADRPLIAFEKGPIFANIVHADEINRATPRTQSALLEAMQEGKVTVSGSTYTLPAPFFVIATQNPIEMEGTYPLPEAQIDRFFFKLEVPFPNLEELVQIAHRTTEGEMPTAVEKLSQDDIRQMKNLVPQTCIAPYLMEYAARLILATHDNGKDALPEVRQYVRYGASPRAVQALVLGAKVKALLSGREHVAKEDIAAVLAPALRHRLILNFEGEAEGITSLHIIDRLLQTIEG